MLKKLSLLLVATFLFLSAGFLFPTDIFANVLAPTEVSLVTSQQAVTLRIGNASTSNDYAYAPEQAVPGSDGRIVMFSLVSDSSFVGNLSNIFIDVCEPSKYVVNQETVDLVERGVSFNSASLRVALNGSSELNPDTRTWVENNQRCQTAGEILVIDPADRIVTVDIDLNLPDRGDTEAWDLLNQDVNKPTATEVLSNLFAYLVTAREGSSDFQPVRDDENDKLLTVRINPGPAPISNNGGMGDRNGEIIFSGANINPNNQFEVRFVGIEGPSYEVKDGNRFPPKDIEMDINTIDLIRAVDTENFEGAIAPFEGDLTQTFDGELEGGVLANPSCEGGVDNALGWVVCPVAEFLLDSLEFAIQDGVARNILNFDTLDEGSGSRVVLQSIWSGFRALANVGFVIAFFVVVYSAATGGALSAYDVKRLLPRLLFGALAVQLSFVICVTLVSMFNAFGDGIVDLMLSPLGGEAGAGSGALFSNSEGILGSLGDYLVAGVSVLILILLIAATVMSWAGILLMIAVFMLRNMALMVLTVLSPLAFVAWIVPNTEKMFKRWWGIYIQLLALFPITMAFLASGRLVSTIWASGDGFANQWLGLIAMFLPYLAAPKLFSFAGSAISSLVNAANGAKDGMRKSGGKLAGSRIGKRAAGSAASRVNRRYGLGNNSGNTSRISRAMERAAQSGIGSRKLASGVDKRSELEREEANTARKLQQDATAGMTNNEKRQYLRNQVESGTGAQQIAALERMLIDNDIDGIQFALESGHIDAATFSQFLDKDGGKNEASLHGKARHLTTGQFDADGNFERGEASVGNVSGDILASSRPETIRQTLADLTAATNSASTPTERRDAEQNMDTFLSNYRDQVMGNPRLRSSLDPELVQQLDAAVRTRAGTATTEDVVVIGNAQTGSASNAAAGIPRQDINVTRSPDPNFHDQPPAAP